MADNLSIRQGDIASAAFSSPSLPPEVKTTAKSEGKIYLVINTANKRATLGLTNDSKLASSAPEVSKFVKNNLDKLDHKALRSLLTIGDFDHQISKLELALLKYSDKLPLLKLSKAVAFFIGKFKGSSQKEVVKNFSGLQIRHNVSRAIFEKLTPLCDLHQEIMDLKEKEQNEMNKNDFSDKEKLTYYKVQINEKTIELADKMQGQMRDIELLLGDIESGRSNMEPEFSGIKDKLTALQTFSNSTEFKDSLPVQKKESAKKADFNGDVNVRVAGKSNEEFKFELNNHDRTDSRRDIKTKGYSERGSDDLNTARKQTSLHFEKMGKNAPDFSLAGDFATLEKLSSLPNFSKEKLNNAVAVEIKGLESRVIKGNSGFVGKYMAQEFEELMNGLPNESIKTLEDLKGEWKKKIKEHNVHEEFVDKETFALLYEGRGIPVDLNNAPEFASVRESYEKGEWADGEEKKISFTKVPSENLAKVEEGIDELLSQPLAQELISKFLV
jgi:hypothetical protein